MDADGAEAALVSLAESPPDGVLRIGALLQPAGQKLVILATDPPGAGRFTPQTEARLDLAPRAATPADVWDVAILVDHSDGMRGALGKARAGVERFLANAADVARNVSLLGYAREPFRLLPLKPLAQARVTLYDGLQARGAPAIVDGLDAALAEVTRGENDHRRAVVLVTRHAAARRDESGHVVDAGLRAKRLGVQLHVWDLSDLPAPGIHEAVRATGGTLAMGDAGLRPALESLAGEIGVPLAWRDAPPPDEEAEFEIVVRAIPAETDGLPRLPRRRKKK